MFSQILRVVLLLYKELITLQCCAVDAIYYFNCFVLYVCSFVRQRTDNKGFYMEIFVYYLVEIASVSYEIIS